MTTRVLQVVSRLGWGGAERVAEALAVGLAERGVDSAVLAVAGAVDAPSAERMRTVLRAGGVEVLGGSHLRSAKLAAIDAPRWLLRAVRSFHPDLVHLHTELPEAAWAFASLTVRPGARPRLIRTIHNSVLWPGWKTVGRLAEGRLDEAGVVAVSHAAARGFDGWRARLGRRRIPARVIYNGLGCEPDGPASGRGDRRRPRLCFAGRFETEKGVDVLLRALSALDATPLDFEVDIFGAGRLAPLVARSVRGFRRSVTARAPIPRFRERLWEYDALLMPSRFEGLPLAAIEALCAGVAVLATSAPGLDEALPPGYPGQCRSGDPAAYAELIAGFIRDPEPWISRRRAAEQWARERFSRATMLSAYLQVYRGGA